MVFEVFSPFKNSVSFLVFLVLSSLDRVPNAVPKRPAKRKHMVC